MDNDLYWPFASLFFMGLSGCWWKIPVPVIGPKKTIFWRNTIICSLLLFAVLFFDFGSWTLMGVFMAILISSISYFGLFFFNKAIEFGSLGIVSPISASNNAVSAILATIIFQEQIKILRIIGMALVLVGVISLSIKKESIHSSSQKSIIFAILAALFWGIGFSLFKIPIKILGVLHFSFILELCVLSICTIQIINSKTTIRITKSEFKLIPSIIGIASFGLIGIVCLNTAYSKIPVNTVAGITSASPLIALLYSRFVYNEKLSMKQYISAFIIVVGLVIVGVNSSN